MELPLAGMRPTPTKRRKTSARRLHQPEREGSRFTLCNRESKRMATHVTRVTCMLCKRRLSEKPQLYNRLVALPDTYEPTMK